MPASSIKLSITVQTNLAAKYPAAALAKINQAVRAWVKADAARGITTLHLALDDAAQMKKLGATAIAGAATPVKVKRALDMLFKQIRPDYVVIFGGDEIVPMFRVPNPSHDPSGDTDVEVPTDNPYACSTAYSAANRKSYLVPDRVLGRISDLTGSADPQWLTGYLKRVATWKPQPHSFFSPSYAVVCDAWKGAGEACMQYVGLPAEELQISPPTLDTTPAARSRLGRRLHMIKCHGSEIDARFFGQKGGSYPVVLDSATLKPRVRPGTLVAAMCCYGAQVFAPGDPRSNTPGQWPLATTYLRQGAVGFAGSTMIAWVGVQEMACADWIVGAHLRGVLGGASLGRALLEAKQDYVKWLASQGCATDKADEKTLIEYLLLGDPSLHPVQQASAPALAGTTKRAMARAASPLLVQERQQRRELRAELAVQIRKTLPERTSAKPAAAAQARELFKAVQTLLGPHDAKALEPTRARVEKLVTPLGRSQTAGTRIGARRAAAAAAPGPRESLEYYWTGRSVVKGLLHIRLLKVETDTHGVIVRTRLLHSA